MARCRGLGVGVAVGLAGVVPDVAGLMFEAGAVDVGFGEPVVLLPADEPAVVPLPDAPLVPAGFVLGVGVDGNSVMGFGGSGRGLARMPATS